MKILVFGSLGERIGRELDVALPAAGCTVAELRARLAATLPELASMSARACIDREMAGEDALVLPHHEVAFVPPLSGG
ncbi:MAG TPA: MoaD/ThiS family protein [Allosphingosinicella sp.]|nr:MoaD/ThiS family protein [Allosphingosinicella sp.]